MEALRLELERSMLSEEMRILYVALTRAKEKLIVTSVQNQLDKKLSGYTSALTERQKISPYVARGAASYADWIFDEPCVPSGLHQNCVWNLAACPRML
mgnify:CR=1 FL=1